MRAVAQDPDTVELVEARMTLLRRVGRPPFASPKVALTARYENRAVKGVHASEPSWQTRMSNALRERLMDHPQHAGKSV